MTEEQDAEVKAYIKELLTCWYLSFIVVIFLCFIVYCIENSSKKRTFDDLFNGFYWGVISMTAIGYGDISPQTLGTKALLCIFGLVGTAFLAMPAISMAAIGYGDISPQTPGTKALLCVFGLVGTAFLAMPAGIMGSGFALQVAEKAKEKYKTRKIKPAALLIQAAWRRYAGAQDYYGTWIAHSVMRARKEARRISRQTGKNIILSQNVLSANHVYHKDADKDVHNTVQIKELNRSEKLALMFTRRLKLNAALRKFKDARKPYDERDILERFFTGQLEMFAKIRQLQIR